MQVKRKLEKQFATVSPDEVRQLLRRNNITSTVIVATVLGSTFVLCLLLAFLFLGYTTLVPEYDIFSSVVASVVVLGTSGGANAAYKPAASSNTANASRALIIQNHRRIAGNTLRTICRVRKPSTVSTSRPR